MDLWWWKMGRVVCGARKRMPSLCNCGHSLVRRGGLAVIRVMVRCQEDEKMNMVANGKILILLAG